MATPFVSGVCALGIGCLRARGSDAGADLVASALRESGADPQGQGEKLVGAGIPQLPDFLRILADSPRTAGSSPGRKRKSEVAVVPVGGAPERAVADAQGRAEAAGPDAEPESSRQGAIQRYLDRETTFLHGVCSNTGLFHRGLAEESLEKQYARLKAMGLQADDEINTIRNKALTVPGLQLPLDDALVPANRELIRAIQAKRWLPFLGHRLALHVVAKSFAGEQYVRSQMGRDTRLEGALAAEYVARRLDDPALAGAPVAFVLFAPDGWCADAVRSSIAGGRARAVALCSGSTKQGRLPFELVGSEYGWYTWLALTPMALGERKRWCIDRLLEHPELKTPGDVLLVSDFATHVDLPAAVVLPLLRDALGGEARFRLGTTDDGEYVERVRTQ
jgi:hypothetical protein